MKPRRLRQRRVSPSLPELESDRVRSPRNQSPHGDRAATLPTKNEKPLIGLAIVEAVIPAVKRIPARLRAILCLTTNRQRDEILCDNVTVSTRIVSVAVACKVFGSATTTEE